jgi:hypothetical protein
LSGSFSRAFFDAMRFADAENLIQLSIAFPDEVFLYKRWQEIGTEAMKKELEEELFG